MSETEKDVFYATPVNYPHTAATGLTITYQRDSEALRLRYCHAMTIRSDESSMVELWWRRLAMPLKGGSPQTRQRRGNTSVIFS
jgi:hypothetical protein